MRTHGFPFPRRIMRPSRCSMSAGEVIANALGPWRYQASLVAVFAALAIVLTCGGLYGALTFEISRRSHEMGVRLVLGARPSEIVTFVVRRGLRLVAAGLLSGVLVAFAAHRALSAFLFGVSAIDLASYLAAAAVVTAFGLVACWLPARRASAADPLSVLRPQ
jgi:putative ABC transport system permease protein